MRKYEVLELKLGRLLLDCGAGTVGRREVCILYIYIAPGRGRRGGRRSVRLLKARDEM